MRRLPLYCEVGPTTTNDRRRRDNFATREVVSSLFVFCVCVIRCAFYNSRVSICVLSAPLLVRYSARCCCVCFWCVRV